MAEQTEKCCPTCGSPVTPKEPTVYWTYDGELLPHHGNHRRLTKWGCWANFRTAIFQSDEDRELFHLAVRYKDALMKLAEEE